MTVTIAAGKPDRRRRDVDNLGKAVLDLLAQNRVIEDDSLVAQIITRWNGAVAGGRILIEVQPATVPVAECASTRGLDL